MGTQEPALAITLADVESAMRLIDGQVLRSPVRHSQTLSALTGAEVWLKLENQQFTASFKERGALTRLLALDSGERARGVICMSAGNHAQAVTYHARRLGIPATIVMPRSTPNAKVEATRVFGPEILLHGSVFDEAVEFTHALAEEKGLTLVHPYDDPAVIAGQGTCGLEMIEDAPEMDAVVVPIGGGGLISGIATVFAARAPQVEIIGVEAARFAGAYRARHGDGPDYGASTVAEGIAVKAPGKLTRAIIDAHVKDILLVEEDVLERAVLMLLEIEKTVAEGAGAAALAAVLAHPERFRDRRVLLPVCGGNIDLMILTSLIQRGLARSGRLVRIAVEIPDVPGALGEICRIIGELDSNIIDLQHQRAFEGTTVRTTGVTFLLQMRGAEAIDPVLLRLADEGYAARRLDVTGVATA